MVNRSLCSSITYRWLTSSGQTQNSRTTCIIYEYHLCSNCSHLWAMPLQMLLNGIKVLVTHVEAMTAYGLQCGLFMIYKSALLFTSGGGLFLGKNLIWVSDEQIALLSSKISLEVSDDTQWDHLPLEMLTFFASYVTAKTDSKFFFCFVSPPWLLSVGCDILRSRHRIQKKEML